MWASRRRACSSSSRIRTAAPSPSTNPLRLRSKGREACAGSSLRGEVALMASKEATLIGVIGASVAPATITSAPPSATTPAAYPSESSPEVQPRRGQGQFAVGERLARRYHGELRGPVHPLDLLRVQPLLHRIEVAFRGDPGPELGRVEGGDGAGRGPPRGDGVPELLHVRA